MTRSAAIALILLAFSAPGALAAEVLMHDEKSNPESIAVAPDGSVFTGSLSSPFIYKANKGAAPSALFVDGTAEGPGTTYLGQFVDAASNTLWACQVTPVAGSTPTKRHSFARAFDIATGKEKMRWSFPGEDSICNDFAMGPDKALYMTDTAAGRVYRLAPGAQSAELFAEARQLQGADGIAFLGNTLYVNNIFFSKLYRIPVDAAGKAGAPVDIWMDAPVNGPDGMRGAGDRLLLVEGKTGRILSLTIVGDTAHVTPIKDGLKTPTGVWAAGDTLWISERATGKAISIPLPK